MNDNGLIQQQVGATVPENGILAPVVGTPEEVKKEVDPIEAAAIYINQSHKHFRQMAYELVKRKKRSAARVLEAVLFEPLEKVELTKDEKNMLAFCNQILYNKGVLLRDIFEKHAEKIQKQGEPDGQ